MLDPASRNLKAERDQLTLRRTTIAAELKLARASGRAADFLTAESQQIRSVLWIRIRSNPKLFAGSGVGSGINYSGSG
jgi:hypothetical protein